MASAAPWTSRAANSTGRLFPNANNVVEAASASMPSTSGSLRPVRSDAAPIGMETVSSVRPNDANSKPIVVGEAPSRRLRSGSTGTAIE